MKPSAESFIDSLIAKKLFWSYDPKGKEQWPDSLIIEQVLYYGDVNDLKRLFVEFDTDEIMKVWMNTLLSDERYPKLNFYLARYFFKIPYPARWLKKNAQVGSRYRKLELLTA